MLQLLGQSETNPPDSNNTPSAAAPPADGASSGTNGEGNSDISNSMNIDDEIDGASMDVMVEERDEEMEDELAHELARADAFSDYDIEVTKEGEAIEEYLALLASGGSSNEGSSN